MMFGFLRRQKETIHAAGGALRSAAAKPSLIPWKSVLVWVSRILALLWLMKGLAAWGTIFGVLGSGEEFLSRNLEYQSAVIYFAVVDLIAAVGLWMVSSWGSVMWLIAVASYIALAGLSQNIVPTGPLVTVALVVLTIMYLVLSWMAAREDMQ